MLFILASKFGSRKSFDKYKIPNPDLRGLYHLSGENIDKYSLLSILNEVYKKILLLKRIEKLELIIFE